MAMALATTLIPGLDDDMAYQCLLRSSLDCHSTMRKVSRAWRKAMATSKFYEDRAAQGCDQEWLIAAGNSKILAFNPSSNAARSWIRLPSPPRCHGQGGFQVKTLGSKIYLLGGWADRPLRDVSVFDSRTGEWSSTGSMVWPRAHFGCAVLQGRLVVAGGNDGHGSRTAEVYDSSTDRWHSLPPCPQPHRIIFANAAVVDWNEVVFASRGGAGCPMALAIDPSGGGSWREANEYRALLGQHCLAVAAHSRQIFMVDESGASWQRLGSDRDSLVTVDAWNSRLHWVVCSSEKIWAVSSDRKTVAVIQVGRDGSLGRMEMYEVEVGDRQRHYVFQFDVMRS